MRGATQKKYETYYDDANKYYKAITGLASDLTYVGG